MGRRLAGTKPGKWYYDAGRQDSHTVPNEKPSNKLHLNLVGCGRMFVSKVRCEIWWMGLPWWVPWKAFAKLGGRSWVRCCVVLTMSEMRGRFWMHGMGKRKIGDGMRCRLARGGGSGVWSDTIAYSLTTLAGGQEREREQSVFLTKSLTFDTPQYRVWHVVWLVKGKKPHVNWNVRNWIWHVLVGTWHRGDVLEENVDVNDVHSWFLKTPTWHFGFEVECWKETCQTYTGMEEAGQNANG